MTPYFEINREGHNIRCRLYSTDSHTISSLIVFCHGFGGHKDNRTAEEFAERVVCVFDCGFAAHGVAVVGDAAVGVGVGAVVRDGQDVA